MHTQKEKKTQKERKKIRLETQKEIIKIKTKPKIYKKEDKTKRENKMNEYTRLGVALHLNYALRSRNVSSISHSILSKTLLLKSKPINARSSLPNKQAQLPIK